MGQDQLVTNIAELAKTLSEMSWYAIKNPNKGVDVADDAREYGRKVAQVMYDGDFSSTRLSDIAQDYRPTWGSGSLWPFRNSIPKPIQGDVKQSAQMMEGSLANLVDDYQTKKAGFEQGALALPYLGAVEIGSTLLKASLTNYIRFQNGYDELPMEIGIIGPLDTKVKVLAKYKPASSSSNSTGLAVPSQRAQAYGSSFSLSYQG